MTDIQQFNKTEHVSFSCSYKEPVRWYMWLFVFIAIIFTGLVIWGTVYDYLRHRNTSSDNNSGTTTNVAMKEMSQANAGNEEPVTETSKVNPDASNEAGSTEGAANANPKPTDDPLPNQKPEAIQERPQMSKGARILMGFSVTTNTSEVMSCKRPPSNLGAINGIRVLSMTWIIWLHTTYYIETTGFIDNPAYLSQDIQRKFWYKLVSEGDLGVDSFFVLSGLLVTYLTLKKMKATGGEISWPLFYFQRYMRLTPLLVFAIGVYIGLSALVGRGYQKNETYSEYAHHCLVYGAANVLYINNLFPSPYLITVCMGWTWYLANDMQFYVISPLFLLLLCRPSRAKFGIALTIAVTVISVVMTMGFSWGFKITGGNYPGGHPDAFAPGGGILYATPWCRIQSYTVGIFVGYLLYKVNGQKKKIPSVWNAVGWSTAMFAVLLPVFAMYFTSYERLLPVWIGGIWIGIKRLMFSSGVGWITYACITGNGGFVDTFLSLKIWLPLAKLSYAAYLFHPIVMEHWIYTSKTEFHWTAHNAIYMFFSFFAVTYIVSFVSSLLVEIPFTKMTKILTERPVVKVQRRDVL
ncbi:Nose resistant to fluoxetine protein 6 [Holothuria leucospilota]|uniref:Nose resistant to fluoxetine protein 6 n=1 Tax=Holothuria leucospilota TaxID=206669 RepID=A0A9Q0YF16_HOLLE|nr:Nose resistant to fluoxetine protein 6 [Holothuria leucospilota]